MVWKYAYCFFQNPEIIFITFYYIFNLDFFLIFCHLRDTLQWRGMVHGLQFYLYFLVLSQQTPSVATTSWQRRDVAVTL